MRLAHPGGNLTGVNIDAEFEIVAKRLQILKDVHQILNGAKPGDIPIYQPNKFQRIINLKAASALGLDPPSTLVARADGVIE
jgi:putative tryptophan/tyrosine transport system substrate-binding protein